MSFLQTKGNKLVLEDNPIVLKGYGLGSWMNIENFMIGFPGTDQEIHEAFINVYGKERTDSFYDRLLTNMFTEEDAKYLASIGVNALRLPFSHRYFVDDKDLSKIRTDGFKYIDKVVSACKKHGIYTILDLHTSPGGQNPDWHSGCICGRPIFWDYEAFQNSVIDMWRAIAEYYKDEESIAGYDILNEPVNVPDFTVFNRFLNKTIAAIREVDKNHIIFVEGDEWAKEFDMIELADTQNIAWSLHLYPGNIKHDYNDEYWNPESMVMEFEKIKTSMKRYDFPIWCGETGIGDFEEFGGDGEEMKLMFKDILDYMNKDGMSWTIWCYKDARAMGTVRPTKNSKWMQLVYSMKDKWTRIGIAKVADDVLANMPYFEELDDDTKWELHYNMKSQLNKVWKVAVLEKALKQIDFEEIIEHTKSFVFEKCEIQKDFEKIIKVALKEG